ncbi:hypothetical protein [Kushneria sp. TE3]|uniref:hypothetical protein n=1 Tax=Kushneria sp. TE3 TaxID=3449832 RepID=UPI003F6841D1
MIDSQMVKDILGAIGEGEYVGVTLPPLIERFLGDFNQAAPNDIEKFTYHMDELFEAGLFKAKDLRPELGWGLSRGLGNQYEMLDTTLVLTPIGGETLEELRKSKGMEKLKQAMRSAGALAGTEALKYGIGALLR